MSLNIKNPEARRLARKLAKRTGESMTHAVIEALRDRLSRLCAVSKREATAEELLAIGRRCAATLKHNDPDHAALLYDESGLPK
jgi:antitoxin VapB